MKKEGFLKQILYESWANNVVIDAYVDTSFPMKQTHQIISHNLNAFSIWLKRLKNEEETIKLWDLHTVDELRLLTFTLYYEWSTYLNSLDDRDFEKKIHFTFWGKNATISVEDLLIHLITHSSYHRGQVMLQLKGKLSDLPHSTYIAFATDIETN